jgi:hypothetical protein
MFSALKRWQLVRLWTILTGPLFELLLKPSSSKTNLFTTGQPVTVSILVTGWQVWHSASPSTHFRHDCHVIDRWRLYFKKIWAVTQVLILKVDCEVGEDRYAFRARFEGSIDGEYEDYGLGMWCRVVWYAGTTFRRNVTPKRRCLSIGLNLT